MKKLTICCAVLALSLMVASCDMDNDNYRHQVGIVYPDAAIGYLYADQTVDSISFYTFDSFKYYPWSENPDNFISINENVASKKIVNDYLVCNFFTLPVYFKPNTADSVRLGYVLVESKSEMDDWSGSVYGSYCQVNWHRISKPSPTYSYNSNQSLVIGAEHCLKDSALQVTDTIKFYAYDKWTLTTDNADMIQPSVTSGEIGLNKIPCTVSVNLGADTVRTSLTLKSENGAKTTIKFQQAPKPKTQEEK